MALKNYTSETSVEKSMSLIEKNLVAAGARNIMKSYNDDGSCTSISFSLLLNGKTIAFQLPARFNKIYEKLCDKYVRPTERSYQIAREQAGRTAWKIISDWVEIQVAMIELDQADILQVFLPYVHDGSKSLYERLKESDFKLLT